MKKKANTAEQLPLPSSSSVSIEDMILLRCSSGEVFLTERNCALVSSECRTYIHRWDGAIRSAAFQQATSEGVFVNDDTEDKDAGGHAAVMQAVLGRASVVMIQQDELDAPVSAVDTIPFACFENELPDQEAVPSEQPQVVEFAIDYVASQFRARVEKAFVALSNAEHAVPRSAQGHTERKVTALMPKLINPLAPIEETDGRLFYPVITLPFINAPLLQDALDYMHFKYKTDTDGEKRASANFLTGRGDHWNLIAAAVLMGI